MIKAKKTENLTSLTEKLKKAKSIIFTDYAGLNVAQINELRGSIKKSGGDYEVVKNTLIRVAAKEQNLPLGESAVNGPTAALWLYSDDLTPLKLLKDFIKKTADLPKIKTGFWENERISVERIDQLASLPSREQLQAQFVGMINQPIYGLVNSLAWNLRSLVQVLHAKVEKGGE